MPSLVWLFHVHMHFHSPYCILFKGLASRHAAKGILASSLIKSTSSSTACILQCLVTAQGSARVPHHQGLGLPDWALTWGPPPPLPVPAPAPAPPPLESPRAWERSLLIMEVMAWLSRMAAVALGTTAVSSTSTFWHRGKGGKGGGSEGSVGGGASWQGGTAEQGPAPGRMRAHHARHQLGLQHKAHEHRQPSAALRPRCGLLTSGPISKRMNSSWQSTTS